MNNSVGQRLLKVFLAMSLSTALVTSTAACVSDEAGDATSKVTSDGNSSAPAAGNGASSNANGAALYEQNCAACHGSDLRGTDKGPSHLSQVYEPGHHSDESFRIAITQGATAHHWNFGDMEPVAGLNSDEIDAIIAYIRGQQRQQGFEPYPPA